eukprot:1160855-Pleurochrysis_carterae.AAC.1
MENNKEDLIVVLAGYKDKMDRFYSFIPVRTPRAARERRVLATTLTTHPAHAHRRHTHGTRYTHSRARYTHTRTYYTHTPAC